ncbi:hypothetical protein BsWGS_16859 [Bradybaena similaris]
MSSKGRMELSEEKTRDYSGHLPENPKRYVGPRAGRGAVHCRYPDFNVTEDMAGVVVPKTRDVFHGGRPLEVFQGRNPSKPLASPKGPNLNLRASECKQQRKMSHSASRIFYDKNEADAFNEVDSLTPSCNPEKRMSYADVLKLNTGCQEMEQTYRYSVKLNMGRTGLMPRCGDPVKLNIGVAGLKATGRHPSNHGLCTRVTKPKLDGIPTALSKADNLKQQSVHDNSISRNEKGKRVNCEYTSRENDTSLKEAIELQVSSGIRQPKPRWTNKSSASSLHTKKNSLSNQQKIDPVHNPDKPMGQADDRQLTSVARQVKQGTYLSVTYYNNKSCRTYRAMTRKRSATRNLDKRATFSTVIYYNKIYDTHRKRNPTRNLAKRTTNPTVTYCYKSYRTYRKRNVTRNLAKRTTYPTVDYYNKIYRTYKANTRERNPTQNLNKRTTYRTATHYNKNCRTYTPNTRQRDQTRNLDRTSTGDNKLLLKFSTRQFQPRRQSGASCSRRVNQIYILYKSKAGKTGSSLNIVESRNHASRSHVNSDTKTRRGVIKYSASTTCDQPCHFGQDHQTCPASQTPIGGVDLGQSPAISSDSAGKVLQRVRPEMNSGILPSQQSETSQLQTPVQSSMKRCVVDALFTPFLPVVNISIPTDGSDSAGRSLQHSGLSRLDSDGEGYPATSDCMTSDSDIDPASPQMRALASGSPPMRATASHSPYGRTPASLSPDSPYWRTSASLSPHGRTSASLSPDSPFGRTPASLSPDSPYGRTPASLSPDIPYWRTSASLSPHGRTSASLSPDSPFGRTPASLSPDSPYGRTPASLSPDSPYGRTPASLSPYGRTSASLSPDSPYGRTPASLSPDSPYGRTPASLSPYGRTSASLDPDSPYGSTSASLSPDSPYGRTPASLSPDSPHMRTHAPPGPDNHVARALGCRFSLGQLKQSRVLPYLKSVRGFDKQEVETLETQFTHLLQVPSMQNPWSSSPSESALLQSVADEPKSHLATLREGAQRLETAAEMWKGNYHQLIKEQELERSECELQVRKLQEQLAKEKLKTYSCRMSALKVIKMAEETSLEVEGLMSQLATSNRRCSQDGHMSSSVVTSEYPKPDSTVVYKAQMVVPPTDVVYSYSGMRNSSAAAPQQRPQTGDLQPAGSRVTQVLTTDSSMGAIYSFPGIRNTSVPRSSPPQQCHDFSVYHHLYSSPAQSPQAQERHTRF